MRDNAPPHKSLTAQNKFLKSGFMKLNHPPNSSDIGPSEFCLLYGLKRRPRGQKFEDKDELHGFFDTQSSNFYQEDTFMLRDRWSRVIDCDVSCFE